MSELIKATVEQVRFDELPRLRELIAQIRARREQSITGNGHSLAMAAASAGMAPARPDLSRSEEHTTELQSRGHLVCRLLLQRKKTMNLYMTDLTECPS